MKVPYGYVWFNGMVLCDAWIDQYNRFRENEGDLRHAYLMYCFALETKLTTKRKN